MKDKMLEFTKLFCIETNIFQRFVIVYKYFKFLNTEPIVKDILQKIFDDTAKIIGEPDENMDENKFLKVKGDALFSREFWVYYTNLEVIHGKMKKLQKCNLSDKTELEQLSKLFSKPYSKKMLELSLEVINSEVFNRLDQKVFCEDDEHDGETYFDEQKGILYIKGERVEINKQDKITNAHKILRHIFVTNKDNTGDDFFFSEIAEDEFHELDYKGRPNNWRKYARACEHINAKVKEQTDGVVIDFLIFTSGDTSKVKVNTKYI